MTAAICLQCGARKHGALTRCVGCGFEPENSEDLSKSILLSDHNLSGDELENVSQQIQAGKQVRFDETQLSEMSEEIASMDMNGAEREIKWFIFGCFLLATGGVVGLVALAHSIFGR